MSTCYLSNTHPRDKLLCIYVFFHLTVSVLDHDQIYNKGDCPSRAHTYQCTCTSVCSCVSLSVMSMENPQWGDSEVRKKAFYFRRKVETALEKCDSQTWTTYTFEWLHNKPLWRKSIFFSPISNLPSSKWVHWWIFVPLFHLHSFFKGLFMFGCCAEVCSSTLTNLLL